MDNLTHLIKALDEKHATEMVILKMESHTPLYDYMVITTAKNERLAAGILRELKDIGKETTLNLKRIEGAHHGRWILADFERIIVHVFTPEARLEYNLEKLWADVERVNIEGLLTHGV